MNTKQSKTLVDDETNNVESIEIRMRKSQSEKFFDIMSKIKKIKYLDTIRTNSNLEHKMTNIFFTIRPPVTKDFNAYNTCIEGLFYIADVEITAIYIANRKLRLEYIVTIR